MVANYFVWRHGIVAVYIGMIIVTFILHCANSLFRHPREGGGPSPERWVCKMGEGMDSRLRGNDEVHVVGVAP